MNYFKKIIFAASFLVIALEVPDAMALGVNVEVLNNYLDINAGEELGFEVNISYPENPTRKNLKISYQIKEGDNVLMQMNSMERPVELNATFVDFISIPRDLSTGVYTINVEVNDYRDVIVSDAANFHVLGNRDEEIKTYFLLVFGAIVLMVFAVVIIRDFVSRKSARKNIEKELEGVSDQESEMKDSSK